MRGEEEDRSQHGKEAGTIAGRETRASILTVTPHTLQKHTMHIEKNLSRSREQWWQELKALADTRTGNPWP
jgi:hypothetical protein